MKPRYAIITDQQAEGSPKSHEANEPASPRQTTPMPPVRPTFLTPPVAETGMFPMLVLSEGAENRDTQDASRTTDETRPASQALPSATVSTAGQLTALIVEDTLELAEILQVTLQRMKIITAHESHVERAVARYHDMTPNLVLLDIGLPDGPGWKVLDLIKESQRGSAAQMPVVIVITAYGDAANRLVGKLHGVYSYLVKPFTPSEVEGVVRSALSGAAG
ncbi:MAG: response regulator [Chloroflexota bacterium]